MTKCDTCSSVISAVSGFCFLNANSLSNQHLTGRWPLVPLFSSLLLHRFVCLTLIFTRFMPFVMATWLAGCVRVDICSPVFGILTICYWKCKILLFRTLIAIIFWRIQNSLRGTNILTVLGCFWSLWQNCFILFIQKTIDTTNESSGEFWARLCKVYWLRSGCNFDATSKIPFPLIL